MQFDVGNDNGGRLPQLGAIGELLLATTLVGVNAWIAAGSFESIARDQQPIEYMLVSPSFAALALSLAAAAVALLALLFLVRSHSDDTAALVSVQTTRHLRPLRWTALSLMPLGLLLVPPIDRVAPLIYALMDLRWVWWGLIALAVARSVAATTRWRMRPGVTQIASVAVVLVLPAAFSILATPQLRFSGALHGDEPKYIRYVENFYQGRGFDIANKPLLADASGPRLFANAGHLARAVPEEIVNLLSHARYVITGQGSRPLESEEPGSGMVFAGKHPGTVYQLHNPGISFLLLPGYVLDRVAIGSGIGYGGEFPDRMPALHITLLALFSSYALALFAVLRSLDVTPRPAATLAIVGVLAMPSGAFAFQIYPEVAAGLALTLLVRASVAIPRGTAMVVGCGVLCGFLPWLHVRFGVATLVTAAAVLLAPGIDTRRRRAFVAGAIVALALLALYTYRLTGSLIPVSTYGSETPLSLARTLMGVPALIVDRVWGLLPHAPVFLLACPGIGAMWRRSPRITLIILKRHRGGDDSGRGTRILGRRLNTRPLHRRGRAAADGLRGGVAPRVGTAAGCRRRLRRADAVVDRDHGPLRPVSRQGHGTAGGTVICGLAAESAVPAAWHRDMGSDDAG